MKIFGNIVDIPNGRIFPGSVEVEDGRIARLTEDGGRHDGFILPGFIDAHVHVESSMLVPAEFARLASAHGTVAAVSDPHEIANVLGISGVRFMMENAAEVPFRFYFGAPSCVPATGFETAGGELDVGAIAELFKDPQVKYLSEMMNFPGVLAGDEAVRAKIELAHATGRRVDGHAPGLVGERLRIYAEAGISADHETLSLAEGEEKIALGMKIQIREGSAAKNFDELFPLIDRHPGMCMFCCDDLHPDDLVRGHIDLLVRRAVARGAGLFNVLRAACLTPVEHYGLETGLLREGGPADFIVVEDLSDFRVRATYLGGRKAAENGKALLPAADPAPVNQFSIRGKAAEDFAVKAQGEAVNVITATDGQVVTGRLRARPRVSRGQAVSDPERDILKIAVVNRYEETRPAVGFIRNFGLKSGAMASSVAHDSHNIVAVGVDDESLARAVNLVIEARGGLAAVSENEACVLPLPVAGLMAEGNGYETARAYQAVDAFVKGLGSRLRAPFMTLSFMALLVIPSLKLSDKGLFDGDRFQLLGLSEGP